MKIRALSLFALLAATCMAGCGRVPGLAPAEPGEAAGSGAALFAALDLNRDGRLTRLEAGMPGFAFDQLDADADGTLGFLEWSDSRPDGSLGWQTQLRSEGQRDLSTGSAIRGEN